MKKEIAIDPNLAYGVRQGLLEDKSAAYPQIEHAKNEDENGYTLIYDYIDDLEECNQLEQTEPENYCLATPEESNFRSTNSMTIPVSSNGGMISTEAKSTFTASAKVREYASKDDEVEIVVMQDNPAYAAIPDTFDDSNHVGLDNQAVHKACRQLS